MPTLQKLGVRPVGVIDYIEGRVKPKGPDFEVQLPDGQVLYFKPGDILKVKVGKNRREADIAFHHSGATALAFFRQKDGRTNLGEFVVRGVKG